MELLITLQVRTFFELALELKIFLTYNFLIFFLFLSLSCVVYSCVYFIKELSIPVKKIRTCNIDNSTRFNSNCCLNAIQIIHAISFSFADFTLE